MSEGLWTAIVAVIVVAGLSLLLRRASTRASDSGLTTSPPPPPELEAADDDEDTPEIVAVTSDGWAFVPVGDREKVQFVPPPSPKMSPDETASPGARRGPEQLGRGDLIAARVVRGAPDHDPWRLEALGRDQEYRAWRFETEDAARAALELVAGRVVRSPRDPDGEPVAIGEADFAAARKREEEIEQELATMDDVEEPDHGFGSSGFDPRTGR